MFTPDTVFVPVHSRREECAAEIAGDRNEQAATHSALCASATAGSPSTPGGRGRILSEPTIAPQSSTRSQSTGARVLGGGAAPDPGGQQPPRSRVALALSRKRRRKEPKGRRSSAPAPWRCSAWAPAPARRAGASRWAASIAAARCWPWHVSPDDGDRAGVTGSSPVSPIPIAMHRSHRSTSSKRDRLSPPHP